MPRVEVVTSLDALDPRAWDTMARGCSAYHTHGWLSMFEEPGHMWYAVARGHDDRLLGALPMACVPDESSELYRASDLFAGLPGPWHDGAALHAGPRRGYHHELVLDPALGGRERAAVLRSLLDAAGQIMQDGGLTACLAYYLTSAACRELMDAAGAAVPLLTETNATLDLPGTGFEDYLAAFGPRRGRIAREIALFDAAGYEVSIEPVSRAWPEAGPLRANVERRYGHAVTDEEMTALLRRHAENVDAMARVVCCRREGRLVGCSVFLERGDTLYLRMVGFDYPRLRDACEYFNVLFYLPVRYAYETGRRRVDFGLGSPAKAFRLARLRPLWTLAFNAAAHGPEVEAAASAWNGERMARWRAEFGRHSPQEELSPRRT
ncbi:GNAT family N-acetyltransferase [Nonomuraea sp. NPDC050404]|uniref:GNAT family N-acetyltransferase n=1 Tax=Nonomuraea sp. NPDC050404 TaxID=3155783 RepID=UPI003404795A